MTWGNRAEDFDRLVAPAQTTQDLAQRVRELMMIRVPTNGSAQAFGGFLVAARSKLQRSQATQDLEVARKKLRQLRVGDDRLVDLVLGDLGLAEAHQRSVMPWTFLKHLAVEFNLARPVALGSSHARQPRINHDSVRMLDQCPTQGGFGLGQATHAFVGRRHRHGRPEEIGLSGLHLFRGSQGILKPALFQKNLVEQKRGVRVHRQAVIPAQDCLHRELAMVDQVEPGQEEPTLDVFGIQCEATLGQGHGSANLVMLGREVRKPVLEMPGCGILRPRRTPTRCPGAARARPRGEFPHEDIVFHAEFRPVDMANPSG